MLGRTGKKSYKDKRKVELPPEKHFIFEGTHEAIVPKDKWEIVQKLRAGRRRNCSTGEKDKFAGLVVCADCGKPMYNIRAKTLMHTQEAFVCGNYRRKTKSCTAHFIRTVVLEEMVLESVRWVLAAANGDSDAFRRHVLRKADEAREALLRGQRRELEKTQRRVAELDVLFQRLFEGHAIGRITDERFDTLSAGYEEEQRVLTQRVGILSGQVQSADERRVSVERFLRIAEGYTNLQELTPSILRELISKIVIFEPLNLGGSKRVQRIQVHYNFIGAIDAAPGEGVGESAGGDALPQTNEPAAESA